MIYILLAAVVLLAIAYIVYRTLDLLARRKFAQSYAAWEPDLEQYYRKQPADSEDRDINEEICEKLEDLLRMQGMI